jgi:hypothetical protein
MNDFVICSIYNLVNIATLSSDVTLKPLTRTDIEGTEDPYSELERLLPRLVPVSVT